MIESITISNFYCFNDETAVSFVAGRERNRAMDGMYAGYNEQNRVNLLKMVYLYGNNGAGKSKLLMAFDVLKELVTVLRDDKTESLPYHPFALNPKNNTNRPSRLELVYHFDGRRYRYAISWTDRVILTEELYLMRLTTETRLFNRWYDEETKTAQVDYDRAMEMDDDTQYVIKTSLLRNNSVISSITNTNIYNKVLHDQLSFFRYGFELLDFHDIDLGSGLPDDKMPDGRELKKVILALLKSIGSNIANYEKIPLPKRIPTYFSSKMKKSMSDDEKAMFMEWMDMSPEFAVRTFHRVGPKKLMPLDLEDQSEGTQEIMRLILCMHQAISEHKTILLDDRINGIHPKTLEQLMKFYLGASADSQFIVASQNFSNLDDPLIRRDSLRFITKDDSGCSHVSQLALGDLHKNQNLRLQVENSDKWGVKPAIDELVLEDAIAEYRQKLVYDASFYYSDLL